MDVSAAGSGSKPGNERKFPRIFLGRVTTGLQPLAGADVFWKDGSKSGVWDISLNSVAVLKDHELAAPVKKGDIVEVSLVITGEPSFETTLEIVRTDNHIVAAIFKGMTPEGRFQLDQFLSSKMIGMNTRLVEPKTYASGLRFAFWFHGPKDTNIYIWMEREAVKRFVMELDYAVIEYENGKLAYRASSDTLSRYTDEYSLPALIDSKGIAQERHNHVIERAIDVVSGIGEQRQVLDEVVSILKRKLPKTV